MEGLRFDYNKVFDAVCKSGKTQQQIADEAGCSKMYVRCLMNKGYTSRYRVSIDYATRIAKALNTTVSALRMEKEPAREKPNFGRMLDGWLKYARISQNDLSRKTGLVPDVLRTIRNGKTSKPRRSTILKLANAFGVTEDEFLAGAPTTKAENSVNETNVTKKQNNESVEQHQEEQKQDVKDECLRNIPVWLYVILAEEISDAHKGFKESTKAADKKCYASIVEMHSRLFVKGNTEQ